MTSTVPARTIFYVPVCVFQSSIHQCGLFADRQIELGEDILTWGGVVFSTKQIEKGMCEPHTAIRLAHDKWIANEKGASRTPDDYMNHSCDPNAALRSCVTITAIRKIERGAEITADYSTWLADSDYAMSQPCKCGSSQCRQSIRGNEWQNPSFARSRYTTLSPYVRSLVDRNGILK